MAEPKNPNRGLRKHRGVNIGTNWKKSKGKDAKAGQYEKAVYDNKGKRIGTRYKSKARPHGWASIDKKKESVASKTKRKIGKRTAKHASIKAKTKKKR